MCHLLVPQFLWKWRTVSCDRASGRTSQRTAHQNFKTSEECVGHYGVPRWFGATAAFERSACTAATTALTSYLPDSGDTWPGLRTHPLAVGNAWWRLEQPDESTIKKSPRSTPRTAARPISRAGMPRDMTSAEKSRIGLASCGRGSYRFERCNSVATRPGHSTLTPFDPAVPTAVRRPCPRWRASSKSKGPCRRAASRASVRNP